MLEKIKKYFERLRYFFKESPSDCDRFCPRCEFYDICRKDLFIYVDCPVCDCDMTIDCRDCKARKAKK